MTLDALIMLVGALVAVMPLLGFPVDMKMWIFFILGVIVVGLGIAVRRRGARQQHAPKRKGEFVESTPSNAMHHDPENQFDHVRTSAKSRIE
ncbi:MAG TPA: hypothetical protein VMU13_00555 [Candidatus Paceibacterota bacterium]|nr:hypothetical protein [Candidatus Paceibacterota bacterium]